MNTLIDEPTTNGKKPHAVELSTPRDYTLAARAIENEASEVEKLAKKNTEAGYQREARTQLGDVSALRDVILPKFRAQQELPLVTAEKLRGAIAANLRAPVHQAFIGVAVVDAKGTPLAGQERMLDGREDRLIENLSSRIDAYAREIAERAYNAGYAARESDPEVIAHSCASALSGIV